MQNERLTTIVLAAGKGTRMNSPLPKVMHPVAGVPMIQQVVKQCFAAGATDVRVVVGHGKDLVRPCVESLGATIFEQKEPLGTADAVRAARIEDLQGVVVIINGDHPLVEAQDIKSALEEHRLSGAAVSVVTCEVEDPGSYGRIVRDGKQIRAIVEARDASNEVLKIREINTGLYVVDAKALIEILPKIQAQNSQKEFYLTDLVRLGLEGKKKVQAIKARAHVAKGVNDQVELSEINRAIFLRKAHRLMKDGVMILDPGSTYIEESVTVGPATVIYPGALLRGQSRVGSFCVVEPNVFISDCKVGDSVKIRAGSYLEGAVVDDHCIIGPYARLRPETTVGEGAHVGNFVELKKVNFGAKAKANHLTYLGDAEIGEGTNIGCGTITCNFAPDKAKYKTVIGKNAFIGSDTQFIAPVSIGDEAVIGSGSTITKDVPARALAVTRAKQVIRENYSPKKQKD